MGNPLLDAPLPNGWRPPGAPRERDAPRSVFAAMPPGMRAEVDRARRAWDQVHLHILALGAAEATGKWVALRLSDGGSDGHVYPDKPTAIRFQLHENQCAYLRIPPGGVTPRGLMAFLKLNEQLYDAGARLADPDRTVIPQPMRTRR